MQIWEYSLESLSQALVKGEITSRQATLAFLNRIAELDPALNSYITVTGEEALKAAGEADERLAQGRALSPLDGVPMALKDIFCVENVLTTCASKMLSNYVPPYDSTVWQRLKGAGAVLLGKCNMDEFAMGSTTESSYYGPCRNPYAPDYVPGGSSGGSAAALAAGLAAYTLGTDTGGSIRQPASFCGVVGLKPTYGLVSRYGIIPYASSLDQAGIFAKTVKDCALVLAVIAGHDRRDSTSAPTQAAAYAEACDRPLKGVKIGLPREFLAEGVDDEIIKAVHEAAGKLAEQGGEILQVSLPHTKYALPAYYILASAEASANLARYDGVRYGYRAKRENLREMFLATRSEGFGPEVKRRIMLGTYALSSGYYDAYYNKTLQVRTLVKQDYDQVFQSVDCLLTPTAPTTAYKIGEKMDDPLSMYMGDVCTVPVNLAGLPGMSVPYSLSQGLPLGLQLIGPPFGEARLFQVGAALEAKAGKLPGPDFKNLIRTEQGGNSND